MTLDYACCCSCPSKHNQQTRCLRTSCSPKLILPHRWFERSFFPDKVILPIIRCVGLMDWGKMSSRLFAFQLFLFRKMADSVRQVTELNFDSLTFWQPCIDLVSHSFLDDGHIVGESFCPPLRSHYLFCWGILAVLKSYLLVNLLEFVGFQTVACSLKKLNLKA